MSDDPTPDPTDPLRAPILAAARAQHRAHLVSLLMLLVWLPILLYRPIAHAQWGWIAIVVSIEGIILAVIVKTLRMTGPRAPVVRALLDAPETITAIDVRGRIVLVYRTRHDFTVLRPPGGVAELAAAVRARCPHAAAGAPPR